MDHSRFDDITRTLAAPSRRSLLGLAGASALAAVLGRDEAEAKKKKCKKPKIRCGKACVNPKTSPNHCGGCGKRCLGDLTCINGQCACADTTRTKCGNACVDLQTDDQNCGVCGEPCGTGQTCINGGCEGDGCGSLRDCGAAGCRECCNSAHCCPPGRPNCLEADGNRARACTEAGVCACAGEYPYYCDALGVNAPMCWDCCVDEHCMIDPFYQVRGMSECYFGNCVCPSDQTLCPVIGAGNPPRCTNTQTDANNCGFCGNRCNSATNQTCVNGGCVNPGPP